jgi:uncharacterized membrane protein YgcG
MGLLLASLGGLAQPSSSIYPKSRGVVSDYANRLTTAQIGELTELVKNYERKTSIEFVVVVVDSLHGLPVRAYAVSLADSWGVGKAGRDNGVVLLWAPNERAYSLRIAEGLKPELSDADATRITQGSLLPKFKRGEYYAGLRATVLSTMGQLGNMPWDERLQARAQAAERERQDEAQRAEEQARQAKEQARQAEEGLRVLGGIAAVLVAAGIALVAFYNWRGRRKKLAELAQASAVIAENLSKAETNGPQVQKLLDDFSKESPEQDLTAQRAELAVQPDRIAKIRLDSTLLDFADLKSYDEMLRIRSSAETEGDLLETTQAKIGEIRTAKAESQALMEQLSRENFAISDVRDTSRRSEIDQMLLQSRQDYELARQNSSMSVVNWLMINDMLSRSHSQVQQAVVYSQQSPSDDDSSSSGGFFSSSSSDSSSSSSDSSSSSSDSGSSSFDSGSSGGGGGFSSGSGSDGSY